jgi:flagellar L-ring protein precursor FlgH
MKKAAPIVVLLLTAAAGAQTTPPSSKPEKKDPKPVNNNTTLTVAQAMQQNGGSLFRASMQVPREPGQAQLRDVSYYGVPEREPRTLKKHDLITVIVREESAFKTQGTTDVKRESELEAKIDEFIKLDLSNWEIQGGAVGANPPSIKGESNRKFKGEGTADRTDSMTARIAAEVVDVKPNGTLVLQGSKTIKNDEETQKFILTGICRAADVSADNSVLSTNLFDLSLDKQTTGAVRDATKRGWITKLLDALNPF